MGGYCEGCGCQGHCTCGEPVIDVAALTARIAELEEENARLNGVIESNIDNGIDKIMAMSDEQVSALAGFEGSNPEDKATIARQCMDIAMLRVDLAASQLHAEQLREALEYVDDTGLLIGQYVIHEKANRVVRKALSIPRDTSALDAYVSEKVKEIIESHAPEGRNVTNAQHVEMRHKFVEQIATLTRQRDLAVEAITLAIDMVGHPDNITYLQQTLDAIKGSEGK